MSPPPIPEELWTTIPPAAQAALVAVFDRLERRVAELQEKLGRDSTNSSQPPSTDPLSVKRRPPDAPSGKRRSGQPGHERHHRELVTPGQVRSSYDLKPDGCRRCGHALVGADPQPHRHQVAELPTFRPVIDDYRLHRLTWPPVWHLETCGIARGRAGLGVRPAPGAVLSVLAGA
jgi:transposase